MKYYSVEFPHGGPRDSHPDESPLSQAAQMNTTLAEGIARLMCQGAGLTHRQAYSWPDGSCFLNVCSDFDQYRLKEVLDAELLKLKVDLGKSCNVFAVDIAEQDGNQDSTPGSAETLAQVMSQPDNSTSKTLEQLRIDAARLQGFVDGLAAAKKWNGV